MATSNHALQRTWPWCSIAIHASRVTGSLSLIVGRYTERLAARGRAAPQFDGRSEIQEIKVLGDWAFMWTKLTVVVTQPSGAQSMTRAGHMLSILKKQSGKWLLARDASMLVPVPNT